VEFAFRAIFCEFLIIFAQSPSGANLLLFVDVLPKKHAHLSKTPRHCLTSFPEAIFHVHYIFVAYKSTGACLKFIYFARKLINYFEDCVTGKILLLVTVHQL